MLLYEALFVYLGGLRSGVFEEDEIDPFVEAIEADGHPPLVEPVHGGRFTQPEVEIGLRTADGRAGRLKNVRMVSRQSGH